MPALEDDDPNKWFLREHTKRKHQILKAYLSPWARILATRNGRLVIVDGFSGRGEYQDETAGEKMVSGSPIILMDLSRRVVVQELICICIERDKNNFENLARVLQEKKAKGLTSDGSIVDFSNVEIRKIPEANGWKELLPVAAQMIADPKNEGFQKPLSQRTIIFLINGEFESIASYLVQSIARITKSTGKSPAPSFYFIDPFSYHGVSFTAINQILSFPRSEVLFTFMSRDINRFHLLESEKKAFAALFNNPGWLEELQKQGQQGQERFAILFKQLLKRNGVQFVLTYRISETSKRQTLYYLIHAANSCKATIVMKDNMTNISPYMEYYGPDDSWRSMQMRLDVGEDDLESMMLSRYKNVSKKCGEVICETIDANFYTRGDYVRILKKMESGYKIIVHRVKSKKTGLDDEDIIQFR